MVSEKKCLIRAGECVRLAGLTDDLAIRDQLINLARGSLFAAHHRSDDARVVPFHKNQYDHDDS
jgi:hypothetical protein